MRLALVTANLCLVPALSGFVSAAVLQRDTPNTSCTAAAVSPKPKNVLCGAEGNISKASQIGAASDSQSQADCALACLSVKSCKSFSYTFSSATGNCRIFSKSVRHQAFSKGRSGELFYNRRCFSSSCSGTQSTTTTTSDDGTQPTTTTTSDDGTQSTTTTTTTDPAAITSILPTTIPDTIYSPSPVADYSDCQFDPSSTDFSLLDLDGVPFVNNNGFAARATEVLDTIPSYTFTPAPDGTDGLYDLVLDGKYLAADTDGEMIFVDSSTGPTYVTDGDQTYITSIFSYSCDGTLLIGIPGVVPFELGTIDGDGQLYGQPILDQFNPGTNSSKLKKRILDDATRLAVARTRYRSFSPLALIVAPITRAAQTGDAPRCPNYPTGLVASDANAKRPPQANGCGSTDSPVPNLAFGQCCNNHDYCYDNCGTTFAQCNDDFRSCNHDACNSYYDGFFDAIPRWGCNLLADFYADVVSSSPGRSAFNSANSDRCTCSCPTNTLQCGGSCRSVINDDNNCGACDNSCGANSFCQFDTCYVPPPPPRDPCDSQNFAYYSSMDTGLMNLIGSGTSQTIVRTDISDKRTCCQTCYSTDAGGQGGCLAYYLTSTYKPNTRNPFAAPYVVQCTILIETAQFPSPGLRLNQPYPAECPLGGAPLSFGGLGQGGTGACDQCLKTNGFLNCGGTGAGGGPCYSGALFSSSPIVGKVFNDIEPGDCARQL